MHGEGAFRRRECAGRCKRAGRARLDASRVHEVPIYAWGGCNVTY